MTTRGGFDCALVLHLHEATHRAALRDANKAKELLEGEGYLVTAKPVLPHVDPRPGDELLIEEDETET